MTTIIYDYNKIKNIHNKLPIMAEEKYLKLKSGKYGWFKSDNFILPFYQTEKLIFRRIFFTTSVIYLNKSDQKEEKKFLNDVVKLSKKNKIDIIDVPQTNAVFNICPDKSKFSPFGTYIVDLNKTEDELFLNLHSKHRNVIRKAVKEGVRIVQGKSFLEESYTLINETYKRQGKKFISKNEFNLFEKYLGENAAFYIALKDNQIQGCAVLLWNKNHSSYYQYGGSKEKPFTGSINLIHWQAMKDMKANGVRFYDFYGARINPEKGSKLEGIQRFKSRFGGELKEGYLWKYNINPLKAFLFKILFKIYSAVKGLKYKGDIIDEEQKRNKNSFNI